MANAFKIKQADQKQEQARSELLESTRGGLAGRERAITTFCQKTGSTRDQALRVLSSNASPLPSLRRMFDRG